MSAANRHDEGRRDLTSASGLGLGLATLVMSLLLLLPLAAVLAKAGDGGWRAFWDAVSAPDAAASLKLTIGLALLVTAVNAVMGTLVAWVLVRDHFAGKRVLEVIIDLPFAMPTIVAGLVLLSLYGPRSPLGVDLAQSRAGVFVALLFVTLPFVVRTVQPVLHELDEEAEEAAASLGARPATIFRRVILPNLWPAISAGAALSFARASSEYGATLLISGNIPLRTRVASVQVLAQLENDNTRGAAAVAAVLLTVALAVIVILGVVQRWAKHHG